jgi:hypothetical protein
MKLPWQFPPCDDYWRILLLSRRVGMQNNGIRRTWLKTEMMRAWIE